jgi:hypothetical protein
MINYWSLESKCVEAADELAAVFRSRFGRYAEAGILIVLKKPYD